MLLVFFCIAKVNKFCRLQFAVKMRQTLTHLQLSSTNPDVSQHAQRARSMCDVLLSGC